MNLNFTISEFLKSTTAQDLGINNIPSGVIIYDNLLNLIVHCLQPIRDKLNKPMIITSGYRCPKLNTALGGSITSHHVKGMACDFVVNGLVVKAVCDFIQHSGIKYTQLIEEYSGKSCWFHISYDKNNLKCENLIYKNGKYIQR